MILAFLMHMRLRASRPLVDVIWVGGSAVVQRETSAIWDASTLGDDTVAFLDSRRGRVGVNLLTGISLFVYWVVVRPTRKRPPHNLSGPISCGSVRQFSLWRSPCRPSGG